MTDIAGDERPVRGSRWSDDRSKEALQSIIEAIAEVAGFDVVGVSAVRDDGYLQLLCVVGPQEARDALLDTLAPVEPLLEAMRNGEDWGRLTFVRHDRHGLDIDKWGWTSDGPRDVPDGVWHPEDLLVAPLYDDDGRYVCVLHRRLCVLGFGVPEYEFGGDRGVVRWPIRGGMLAARGRDQGFLELEVHRRDGVGTARDGEPMTQVRVELEVAHFYPRMSSRIAYWIYQHTQSRYHVLLAYGFIRSLGRAELPESAVGRLANWIATDMAVSVDPLPDDEAAAARPPADAPGQ